MPQPDLLKTGIYSIPEAAALVDADQPELRVWVEGRKGRQAPIIDNDVGRLGNRVAVSFTNLMELRFVALFAKAGVRLNDIRAILDEARTLLNHPHPFATNAVFKTDGRRIIAEIGRNNGVDLYDLRTRNFEFKELLVEELFEDVVFDPNGDAASWRPRPSIAPNVILHPAFSFGQPILKHSRIPTEAIVRAVKAEGNVAFVAKIFEIPPKQVREAVVFNDSLRLAA